MTSKQIIYGLIIFALFALMACTSEEAKYFAGELTYNYSYKSTIIDADSISRIRPHKGIFRYDKDTYQSLFIHPSKDSFSYYYLSENNIAVVYNKRLDRWRCQDYGIATDSIVSFNLLNTSEKVLGYNCKILEFKSLYATNRYYVSTDLKLSRNLYKNHEAYNWQFYGNAADGGVILKLEHRFNDHTMTGTLESISFFDKNEKAFQLDKNFLKEKCVH